jgi:hypothetical protein
LIQVRVNVAPVPGPLLETCATGLPGTAPEATLPALVSVTVATAPVVTVATVTTTPLPRLMVLPTI